MMTALKPFLPCLFAVGLLFQSPVKSQPLPTISPQEAGYSAEKLAELEAFLEQSGSSSLVLVHDGQVVFEWGASRQKHLIHSIRKALLNSLVGIYVEKSVIDTSATLAELGIDDIEPRLTPQEKQARVADLLKSKSGVYHPAAAVSQNMLRGMPERGTHQPGEHYYYNNWDFNTLGHILEIKTGESIYTLFQRHIAEPIGMLQYEGTYTEIDGENHEGPIPQTDGVYQYERSKSAYPAYHFRMSAHDLAKYGTLYLREGNWDGQQIIPKSWIEASTTAYSITNPRINIGYGLLWNVLIPNENRATKSFFHTGAGIHMLGVYPGSKLVIVHRVDTESRYYFQENSLYQILDMIFAAQQ